MIRMLSVVGQSSDISLYYEILWGLRIQQNAIHSMWTILLLSFEYGFRL